MGRRHRRGRPVHGLLLVDKPPGGSSNHALQRVKRLFGAAKAGHTGSLDPLATGMLPVCLGEATKLAAHLIDADKGYETELRLGVTTDSADADGTVIDERALPEGLDAARFEALCRTFVGPQLQVPPMVSAIRIDGQRLYKLAREGITVAREPRPVTIGALEVLAFDGVTARLGVRCSKGTYIRSLVTDIGERLGCGAHVTALRRTFVAPFEGCRMYPIEALEAVAAGAGEQGEGQAALDALLLPPDAGLAHLPEVALDAAAAARFRSGQAAPFVALDAAGEAAMAPAATAGPETALPSLRRVRESSGRLLGLGSVSSDGRQVAPRRVLQWGDA